MKRGIFPKISFFCKIFVSMHLMGVKMVFLERYTTGECSRYLSFSHATSRKFFRGSWSQGICQDWLLSAETLLFWRLQNSKVSAERSKFWNIPWLQLPRKTFLEVAWENEIFGKKPFSYTFLNMTFLRGEKVFFEFFFENPHLEQK